MESERVMHCILFPEGLFHNDSRSFRFASLCFGEFACVVGESVHMFIVWLLNHACIMLAWLFMVAFREIFVRRECW